MAVTAEAASVSTHPVEHRTRSRGVLVAVLVAVAAVVALVAVLMSAKDPAPTSTQSEPFNFAPYAVGGSVFNSQVPAAARPSSPLVPGGSTFEQQVPAAGRR